MKSLKNTALLACVTFLAACGGGGGGSSSAPPPLTVASLTGTWYGTEEDASSNMHTLSVTVGSGGYISQVLLDGLSTGQTGFITQSTSHSNLFSSTLSDGTAVGFFADSSGSHVAYLDIHTNVGALQKGASALPTFASTDVGGNWSGYGVTLDSAGNLVNYYSSSATVNGTSGAFSGTDGLSGAFTGQFSTWSPASGRYSGNYTITTSGVSGVVRTFLSPDKKFAMSYSCPSGATNFISGCGFAAWSK